MVAIAEAQVSCSARLEDKGLLIKPGSLAEEATAGPRTKKRQFARLARAARLDLAFQVKIEPRVEFDQPTAFGKQTFPPRLRRVVRADQLDSDFELGKRLREMTLFVDQVMGDLVVRYGEVRLTF